MSRTPTPEASFIKVMVASGWKCSRCWKTLPEVGLCEEYPNACLRCAAAVAEHEGVEIELDVQLLAAKRFDKFLKQHLDAGVPLAEAVKQAGKQNMARSE